MIKKSGSYNVAINEKMKDGNGVVEIHHLFEGEEFGGCGRVFGVFYIKPGDSIGYHKHEGEQEAYYILEGEANYNDNGTEVILKAGDMALCKDGESHGIAAVGDKTLAYIALITYTK
ncbi:cupin domain-containing protein [Tyzzerella sp. OttesenSCG-928-J15]|nr:cupin domain-containing protein [Tyzzerella sp. OttesenSCG-928-J15]